MRKSGEAGESPAGAALCGRGRTRCRGWMTDGKIIQERINPIPDTGMTGIPEASYGYMEKNADLPQFENL
jgi:hypothetical protein